MWPFGFSAVSGSDEFDSHPLVQNIRAGVTKYREQSPTHFAIRIPVFAVDEQQYGSFALSKHSRIKVGITNYPTEATYDCRPLVRYGRVTKFVQVHHKNRWIALEQFLVTVFPVESAWPTIESLSEWWACNGKSFNWLGLPTELKLHILQFCVQGSEGHSDYNHAVSKYWTNHNRNPGPYEVVDILGDWMGLLTASSDTRELALKLCIEGSDMYCGGLTILVPNLPNFKDTLNRLGRYYQMVKADGVPTRDVPETFTLARRYLDFPKQYPELDRFATMRHGIRKLCIQFEFIDVLHFWKVTEGGFKRHTNPRRHYITCDAFEQLPCLDGLRIFMPGKKWKDGPCQDGPQLWDKLDPCPRKLHRMISKRMAVALAPYKDVQAFGFMDKKEEQNFDELHDFHHQSQKFTQQELQELYEDCGGGIQLHQADLLHGGSKMSSCETLVNPVPDRKVRMGNNNTFWPPICECAVPCSVVWYL
jgi:hypothetical protein